MFSMLKDIGNIFTVLLRVSACFSLTVRESGAQPNTFFATMYNHWT